MSHFFNPKEKNNDDSIVVRGARVHNLKNISVTLPRDQLVVITGPSGSGKSSLAFDTIYAEGQRRYVESLSAYARQFLEQVAKPEVESISGLSPTISIEQKTTSYNPRSTVGTVTEIYDYLRLLYSRVGKPVCWNCSRPIQSQSHQQITDTILASPEGSKISLLAPVIRGRKGEYQKELAQLRQRGFVRVKIDGEVFDLSEEIAIDKNKKHDISVYIDRLVVKPDTGLSTRVSDSVDLALKMGQGSLILDIQKGSAQEEVLLSEKFACTHCNLSYPEPEPRAFSFNSPAGACPDCEGLGIIPEAETLEEDPEAEETVSMDTIRREEVCPSCKGARLRKESLHYLVGDRNIFDLCSMPVTDLADFFTRLKVSQRDQMIAHRILKEIHDRLSFLVRVGADYLSLARASKSLSGGESQRIRLATQIGSSLVGVIYVLDEPSIGLHPRDNDRLVSTLKQIRDRGNSVLVVEHDRETMESADWIIDMGPGAGLHGGEIVSEGTYKQILQAKDSMTGRYLSGKQKIPVPKARRTWTKDRVIKLSGAKENNLKNVNAEIPLGVFTCVTGVSGSGKSSLIIDTLYRHLAHTLYRAKTGEIAVDKLSGTEHIDKVIDIDQSPIGRTPRSNPATYTGLFGLIRQLFASLPDAQVRGLKPGHFSFNVKGGRCENCMGDGVTKIEMHFLPDVYVECEVCHGRRYTRDTLEIQYKGKSIADVLEMSAEEAYAFFEAIPTLKPKLKILNDVGLGYITLGQNATTLSGGEAQRIKLSRELARRDTGRTLYILDEPTTGLHFDDVGKLIKILQALVDQGNTVIVIEHNLDLIKVADYILDVGPEGGAGGGKIVASGTPEEVCKVPASHTGRFLKPYLS